jgi:hypothetical protein
MISPGDNMNTESGAKDDLQTIKGIGKSIARALDELGIQSYAELAGCDPADLLEMLSGKLPSIAIQRASPESWIQEARELVGEDRSDMAFNPENPPDEAWDPTENNARAEETRTGWLEIADFFLSFGYEEDDDGVSRLMTRAHHSQADQQMEWQGIPTADILHWLSEQAQLPLLASDSEPSLMREDSARTIRVTLSHVWVSEVRVPASRRPGVESSLLRVSGNLNLSGQASQDYVQDRLEYAVDILLVNTATNRPALVATYTSHLSPEKLSYQIQQDFKVPGTGRYQLYLMARLPPPAEAVKFVQGPIIVVEG